MRGAGDPGPELAALRETGVVRSGAPHPALARGLRAVAGPVCRLRLTLTDERGPARAGEGWVSGEAAALLLDLPDGARDFVTLPPAFLPAAIARVVRLGPRPRAVPEPVPVHPDLVGPWRVWRAQMTWSGPQDDLTRRAVHVVDAEAGLFLVAADGDRATLWPTTPTAVWRLLIQLLPDSDELGR